MKLLEVSESQWLMLERGTPTVITVNAPCRFSLETARGNVIKGLITPDTSLGITSQGDITNAVLRIDGATKRPHHWGITNPDRMHPAPDNLGSRFGRIAD